MARRRSPRTPPALDAKGLEEMAVRYVGRYATSRAKLTGYLARKLRERGWSDAGEPDLHGLAARFCELGYVDDCAYALAKSQSLTSRGYGRRRLEQTLRVAGIGEGDSAAAREHADREAVEAALHYAKRRRIGPFSAAQSDPRQREKALAAMVRAGHPFSLAQAVVDWPPDSAIDPAEIADRAGLTLS